MSLLLTVLWATVFLPGQELQSSERDTLRYQSLPESYQYHRLTPMVPEKEPSIYQKPSESVQSASPETTTPDTVFVWHYDLTSGSSMAESDSTLRWLGYLNLAERFYRKKGAQLYRQGTLGRQDGLELHTYHTRDIRLTMEGLVLNSPLNDAANWNRIAIHKIAEVAEREYGAEYQADVRLRDYYLVEPRTYLNFDESAYNFRSLDFVFTQNFRKDTNVEFSFWDRRDGGGYSRQEVQGRQASVKAYHQLSHLNLIKVGYINNAMDRQEPFGYTLSDPQQFNFNRFIESPLEGNAESNQTSSDIYLQLHQRRDTTAAVSRVLGLHLQTDKWETEYSADTLSISFRNIELYAQQKLAAGNTELQGTGRLYLLNETSGTNLTRTAWTGGEAEIAATHHFLNILELNVGSSYRFRSDNHHTSTLTGRLEIQPAGRVKAAFFAGLSFRAPDLQALYWRSDGFSGDENLDGVRSSFAGARVTSTVGKYLTLGLRGDVRTTSNDIFVGADSTFSAIDPYQTVSATGWIALDTPLFEGEFSGNWRNYQSDGHHPTNQFLNNQPSRTTLKAKLYWKNYLFERATFVKAGLVGHFSPQAYHAAEYLPELNRWQYGTQSFLNPSHTRLDAEVSARVRWFMVLLRWENVLDRVNQLGYFETVGYPMPERRFIFGLRVLFTN